MNNVELANMNNVEQANMNNVELANMNNVELVNMNNVELANMNNVKLASMNNVELACMNNVELACMNNVELTSMDNVELASMNNVELTSMNNVELANRNNVDNLGDFDVCSWKNYLQLLPYLNSLSVRYSNERVYFNFFNFLCQLSISVSGSAHCRHYTWQRTVFIADSSLFEIILKRKQTKVCFKTIID